MNIDNALYTLNIAPDARQLTVFIDGEAIPQSRPKIATRGKNGVPLPHAIAYYKNASIYYRQQCEYCIKQAVQKSGIFFKDVALFCEVYIFLPVPASKSKKFKAAVDVGAEFPKVKPDCDNLFKNIFLRLLYLFCPEGPGFRIPFRSWSARSAYFCTDTRQKHACLL